MLKNKTVVISGIGPGLGQELAYGAAEHGANCVLAARSKDKLNEVQEKINKDGGNAISVPADITNQEDCKNLIDAAVNEFGAVDCLLNSAYRPGNFTEFLDSDLEDWKETMNTNFLALLD